MILEHYQRLYEIYCDYSIFLHRPLRVDKMNSYRRYLMAFATTYYLIATNQQHKDHVLDITGRDQIRCHLHYNGFDPCLFFHVGRTCKSSDTTDLRSMREL